MFCDLLQGCFCGISDTALKQSIQKRENIARLGMGRVYWRDVAAQVFPMEVDSPADTGLGANAQSHQVINTMFGQLKVIG